MHEYTLHNRRNPFPAQRAARPANGADALLRLLLRHVRYWQDEADRLTWRAEDNPALRAVSLISAALCRQQAVAALRLRDTVGRDSGHLWTVINSILTTGNATVLIHTGRDDLAGWACYGCGSTYDEFATPAAATSSAAAHASSCMASPIAMDVDYRESVARQGDDQWRCLCGNQPSFGGFDPCDAAGALVEQLPAGRWDGLLNRCAECDRIIESGAGIVLGRAIAGAHDEY
jgi:hypothetical protein